MKKLLLFLFTMMLSAAALFAQAPQKMSYQAVVRNASNALVAEQNVSAKISILQGSTNGEAVYVETHNVITNANGLLTLEVGDGTAVTGTLASVNWGNGPFFLKSEIDPAGGINYSITSTQQLLSVPYALYAEKAGNVPAFAIAPTDSGYVISITQPGQQPQTFFLPTGGQGSPGPEGPAGSSAYQIWLDAGNTGTESDFLASLAGTSGNDGNDGTDGRGILSIAKTGTEENVDIYTITYTDSTTSTFTVTNGIDGQDGTNGNDGVSPTITVSQGDVGTVLIITDVNGTQQVVIPSSSGSGEGGTLVQQQANWSDTNITSVTYILNKPTKLSQFENDLNFVSANDIPAQQQADWNETDSSSVVYIKNKPEIPTVPTHVSELTNDAGYITMDSIPAIPVVPTNVSEFTNDAGYITMDSIPEIPEIPTKLSDLENDMGFITAIPDSIGGISIEYDPIFTAWDKDYHDLINTPDIPTVPTNVSEFTNDAGYITMDSIPTIPTVPTNVSEFINDAGYITMDSIPTIPTVPTNVSEFTNDAGYITMDSIPTIPTVPTNVSEFINDAGYITMDSIPEIPDPQVNADWNATSGLAEILNKPDIAGMQNTMDSLQNAMNALQDNLENAMGFICGVSKIKDYDGNEYNTVKIGNQCWTKENIRTTHYDNGVEIPLGTGLSANAYTAYRYYPNNDSSLVSEYGYLYNHRAVANRPITSDLTDIQGICPKGWHVPNLDEFNQLIDYVSSQSDFICGNTNINIAKALTSTTGWRASTTDCSPGNEPELNNATGFGAQPAGYWASPTSEVTNFSSLSTFWLTYGSCVMNYSQSNFWSNSYLDSWGLSSRCLRNSNNVSQADNSENLQEVISGFSCGRSKMKDIDGNEYSTVQIGDQCWMKENLRVTHFPDGNLIPQGTNPSYTDPYRWAPNNDTNLVPKYGYLYNWVAVMNGDSSSNNNPSGVQGICPPGWHIPSVSEINQLTRFLFNHLEYSCNNTYNYVGKAMASVSGWNTSTIDCAIGNDTNANNASGLSVLPAGYGAYPSYNLGNAAYIFSCYENSSENNRAFAIYLEKDTYSSGGAYVLKSLGANVRCLRNNLSNATQQLVDSLADVAFTGDYNDLINTPTAISAEEVQNMINNVIAPLQNLINQQQNTIDSLQNILQNLTEELEENSTISFKCGTSIVKDHEGNRYHTVRIGEQCWLKENLRTTTSPSTGAYLVNPLGVSGNQYTTSYTSKVAHWYLNDSLTYAPKNYGLLYNWCAAMDTFQTDFSEVVASTADCSTDNIWYISPAETEMRRGICPAGWHLPTSEEWTTMEIAVSDSVGNLNETNWNIYRGSHAGRLAGGNDWQTSTNEQAPGNFNYSERNASGFGALPAGCTKYNATQNALFWTATQVNWRESYYRRMSYSSKGVNIADYYGTGHKEVSMSVRCLKD